MTVVGGHETRVILHFLQICCAEIDPGISVVRRQAGGNRVGIGGAIGLVRHGVRLREIESCLQIIGFKLFGLFKERNGSLGIFGFEVLDAQEQLRSEQRGVESNGLPEGLNRFCGDA